MNQVIQTLQSHRSIRNYTADPVKEADLQAIIQSAIHGPSTMNGQQWSVILIQDKEKRASIAKLCNNQDFINKAPVFLIFLMDFSRIASRLEEQGLDFANVKSIEAIMVGSVDVGIALGNAMAAAESLGYGIVPIGAVRNEPFEIIELLNLPKYVYPMVGMCIGVEEGEQALKPRLPIEAFISVDTYQPAGEELLDRYDETIKNYLLERNAPQVNTWSGNLGARLSKVYYPKVKASLAQQGFTDEV